MLLSLETQALIRTAEGLLFFILLCLIIPFSRPYFTSAKYGGCIDSSKLRDVLFSPWGYRIQMSVWFVTAAMLACGIQTLLFSAINLLFCYVHFVRLRWKSIYRGMGAPGFISFWLALLIFLLEYSLYYGDREGKLRDLVVLAFRFDFAIMMIDSGINKIGHGYAQNRGMNFGMANPAWGYWYKLFQKLPHDHWLFRFMNCSAIFFQIFGGVCMLIPPAHWIGAATIAGSFLLVKVLIRLGVLCEQLILITALFAHPNGWLDQLLHHVFPAISPDVIGSLGPLHAVNAVLSTALWTYIFILPVAKLAMYYNFYFKKTLPDLLQKSLETFTSTFGVILWRVFTIDLINFYITVSFENRTNGKRTPYTRFGPWSPVLSNRFLWVGESIMSLIVFNTERYFPQPDIFRKRLIQYARTMPYPAGHRVIFDYVILEPHPEGFRYRTAREFRVDPKAQTFEMRIVDAEAMRIKERFTSPVRASVRPGSYAPPK